MSTTHSPPPTRRARRNAVCSATVNCPMPCDGSPAPPRRWVRRGAICKPGHAGPLLPLPLDHEEACRPRRWVRRGAVCDGLVAAPPRPGKPSRRRQRRNAICEGARDAPERLGEPSSPVMDEPVLHLFGLPMAEDGRREGEPRPPASTSSSTTTTKAGERSPSPRRSPRGHRGDDSCLGLDFDAHAFSRTALVQRTWCCLDALGLAGACGVSRAVWRGFVLEVASAYDTQRVPVPGGAPAPAYHNFRHAADVFQAAAHLLGPGGAAARLSRAQSLAVLVAAITHDIGHPGVPNAFLDATDAEVAVTYSGRSVLESHHAAAASRLVLRGSSTLLRGLSAAERREVLDTVRSCILGTDMARHADVVAALSSASSSSSSSSSAPGEPSVLCEAVLHAADLSNVARPRAVSARWTELLVAEFHAAGDLHRARGMPVPPLLDRFAHRSVAEACAATSVGFIRHVALPFFDALARELPGSAGLAAGAHANLARWEECGRQ